jgi:hypothetical protein
MRLRSRLLPLAYALVLVVGCSPAPPPAPTPTDGCVVVAHEYHACYSDSSSEVLLRPVGDTYASASITVPRSVIDAARAAAFASREPSRDVLEDLGVDPTGLDQAAAHIAAAFFEHSGHAQRNSRPDLTAPLKQSATPREIHARLVREITVGPTYMASRSMEITLPGEPLVTVTNESLSPFYLPWRVASGDEFWTTTDVRLTRALAPLIWRTRSFDDVVAQWREHVWRDISIWGGLTDHAEVVLPSQLYTAMRGFAAAAPAWHVTNATCGLFALRSSEMLFLDLRASRTRSFDAIRWYVPIVENGLANDWTDLLKLAEAAERAVDARPWLVTWKSASSLRSLELQAVGARPHDPQSMDERVLRAWREAELLGSPEFEFLLRLRGEAHATVYLSGDDASGLVLATGPQPAAGRVVFELSSVQGERSYFDADGKAHAFR